MLDIVIKAVIETVAVFALLWATLYNHKTGAISDWEQDKVAKVLRWFRKTRLCKELNRMIRAYEMAHQEVKK